MAEIIPAVMAESVDDLRDKLSLVEGLVPLIQLDVMDGEFVPSRDWPYTPGGFEELRTIIEEEEGLPFWNSIDYEIDLMVERPEEVIADWVTAGVRRVIVHFESTDNLEALCTEFAREYQALDSSNPPELGLAVNIDTPNEEIEPYLEMVDFVQYMGIERIGYQEQPFDERVLLKIADLRVGFPDMVISVDGGVNLETAPLLIAAGADRLAVGSALFETENIEETLAELKSF